MLMCKVYNVYILHYLGLDLLLVLYVCRRELVLDLKFIESNFLV